MLRLNKKQLQKTRRESLITKFLEFEEQLNKKQENERRHKKIPKQVEENAIKDAKDAKKKEGDKKLKDEEEEKRKQ